MAKLESLKAARPKEDFRLCRSFDESDGQKFCESCHSPLSVTFTDYAVKCELDHWLRADAAPNWGNPVDANSVDQILYIWPTEEDARIKKLVQKLYKQISLLH